ncbi:uncharacterized protein CCOS01_06616 [Colletotrichum costaricense]|uniref:Secreted protein n=1 Tax=Colletotrichum costaricense TaxID=1209916 RepID=A0AAI9YYG5_9PEZI|nr:uncharacterized protein CCOS01_06616 [Colletotrichum costaricense]KAK1528782.1 hypothetical protein CCOS01_06616 [Colletotrichum costaricense]
MSLFQHRQLAPTAFSFIQLCLLLCASSLPPNIFGRGMELKTQVRGVLFPWLFLSRPFLCVCLSLASSCWRSAFSLSRTRIRSIGCRCQSYCRINKFSPFFLTQARAYNRFNDPPFRILIGWWLLTLVSWGALGSITDLPPPQWSHVTCNLGTVMCTSSPSSTFNPCWRHSDPSCPVSA